MDAALERLADGARTILGRPLSDPELGRFHKYMQLLVKWQSTQRLVGSTDPGWIVDNLLLDSLLFLRVVPGRASSVADVGSGAGLPGVPLGIVRGDLRLALIESRERRASFLAAVVRELPLDNVRVVSGRVEEVARQMERQFDAVVMRCAGHFSELAMAAGPLVVPGGMVIASGPPTGSRGRLAVGGWVNVPGLHAGRERGFAVYQV